MVYLLRYRGLAYSFRPVVATGGTITNITVDGIPYRVHTFSNVGSFNFEVSDPGSEGEVEYLVVAGGGGGGAADNEEEAGAGGGAGGLREGILKLSGTGNIPVTVGAAGAGGPGGSRQTPRPGRKGSNSSFENFVAAGGGGGLTARSGDEGRICDGGSGGGGTGRSVTFGIGNVPATIPPQGTDGARGSGGFIFSGLSTVGGGGGGANGAGSSNSTGGAGRTISISGSPVTYSKGGNGGIRRTNGAGHSSIDRGSGGAGAGARGERAGDPNQFHPPGFPGINGIVIARYPLSVIPA
jgi:hypothetical protein